MQLLKDITEYHKAVAAYNAQVEYFHALGGRGSTALAKKQSQGGLAFLRYLQTYLALPSFWLSWSKAGAIEAARRLHIPLHKVARTTNHLESFNGQMKAKYYSAYMRSGRLPRVDVWCLTMVTRVIPDFFAEYTERRNQVDYFEDMRHAPESPFPHVQNLIPSPRQSRYAHDKDIIVDELSQDVEKSFLLQLEEDGRSEMMTSEDDTEDLGDVDISACNIILPLDLQVDECSSESQIGNTALDSSDIIQELSGNVSLNWSYPGPCGQPSPPSSDLDILDMDLLSLPIPAYDSVPTSNATVTAYQELVSAEDELAERIRHFLHISTDPSAHNLVTQHISPRLKAQLPEWTPSSNSVQLPHEDTSCTQRTSLSPAIALPMGSKEPLNEVTNVAFVPQLKSCRIQSYSIR